MIDCGFIQWVKKLHVHPLNFKCCLTQFGASSFLTGPLEFYVGGANKQPFLDHFRTAITVRLSITSMTKSIMFYTRTFAPCLWPHCHQQTRWLYNTSYFQHQCNYTNISWADLLYNQKYTIIFCYTYHIDTIIDALTMVFPLPFLCSKVYR